MNFVRPEMLGLALALPALVALGIAGHVRRRRRVARILGGAGSAQGRGTADLSRFPALRFTDRKSVV